MPSTGVKKVPGTCPDMITVCVPSILSETTFFPYFIAESLYASPKLPIFTKIELV